MLELIKVFVYGTLKVGGYYAHNFNRYRIHVEKGTIKGRLYGNLNYPRLIISPNSIVHGELHIYKEPDKVLPAMDRIEGYIEGDNHNLYNRKKTVVELENGTTEEAFVYEYALPIEPEAKVIESGNWEI